MPSVELPKTYKCAVVKEAHQPFELVEVDLKLPEAGQVRTHARSLRLSRV